MLGENIRQYRRAKGMSQEEMAVKLHVVRQTVSKWEKGLSVPDADVLVCMAQLLEVSVSELLGVEERPAAEEGLAEELERVNRQLAEKIRRERRMQQAGHKRGWILFLSFLALLSALTIQNEAVAAGAILLCALAALVILYRNLALLTSVTTDDLRLGALRITTLVNGGLLLLTGTAAVLTALDILTFSEHGESMFAMALIAFVMIFSGIMGPRLPFSRHTGLRLPWTVRDEETWNVAHRVLGITSLPAAVLYVAAVLASAPFEEATACAVAAWIGIPAAVSGIFFWKKWSGKA